MEKFKIEVQETLARIVEVEATDLEEAISIIKNKYDKSAIVLDYNDLVKVYFLEYNSRFESDEIKMLIEQIIEHLYEIEKKNYRASKKKQDHIFLKLVRLLNLIRRWRY